LHPLAPTQPADRRIDSDRREPLPNPISKFTISAVFDR
jgi:hypothetical protein